MSLIQMSAAAGILILGIVLFRFLFVHRLPKKVMILLWEIAILRLLFPIAIPLPIPEPFADMRSLISTKTSYSITAEPFVGNRTELEISEGVAADVAGREEADWGAIARMIYLLGAAAMLSGSVFLYIRDSQLFKEGLPMTEKEKEKLIALAAIEDKDFKRLQEIRFKTSDRTSTPVTYGWIHPAIVFPKGLHLKEGGQVRFCLQHELVHIKNFDNLKKLLAHLALCIHWFNPLVWAMYLLFNRDMELLCDETVVRRSGGKRQDYAMTLLSMAAGRNMGFGTGLGFGKSAVKERIVAVMTLKKTTLLGVLATSVAVTAALTVFITNSDVYAMRTGVFASSEDSASQISVAWEGTEMETYVVNDVSLNLKEQEYAADTIQEASIVQDRSDTEYAVSASTEYALMEESAEMTDSMRGSVEELVDEFGAYGLSAEFTENDYQLYYNGEPIYFFADNRANTGFSGRVFSQSADGAYGDTGVITKRDDDGEITGLIQLSMRESKIYSNRWW